MRKRAHLALVFAATHVHALAQQDCRSIAARELRLACYDSKFGTTYPSSEQVAPSAAPPPAPADTPFKKFLSEVRLADESTPGKGLGSDPASISWATRDGQEYTALRAALIWEQSESPFPDGSFLSTYGWGLLASASVNRNTLATKKADTRQVEFGIRGTGFSFKSTEQIHGKRFTYAALDSKLTAGLRENKVDGTHSNLFIADNVVVTDYLVYGQPYQTKFALSGLPRFGFVNEDVRKAKAGVPTGDFRSVYAGLKVEAFPAFISDRMRWTASVMRFVDVDVSGGNTKRRETYAKIGADYFFYSPFDKPGVQPSIGIERSIGADLLNGVPRFGQTQLLLKLKVN